MPKQVYILENLDCANCAAKIEAKFNALAEVEEATITFATGQLRLTAQDPDALIPKLTQIGRTVEPDLRILPRDQAHHHEHHEHHEHQNGSLRASPQTGVAIPISGGEAATEHHHDHCNCGHDHDHHHHCDCGHHHENKSSRTSPQAGVTIPISGGEAATEAPGDQDLRGILIGAGAFLLGLVLEFLGLDLSSKVLFLGAWLVLGLGVLQKALKNLGQGHVLDENFLMSLATLGAFCINEFPEAVGIMLFYRVGEYFEEKAVARSRTQIMEAVDLRPETVNRIHGDHLDTIPAGEARVGDRLLVRPGDRIPLDGVVVSGESRIDTAPITGEPVPVAVKPGDPLTSGCLNTSGTLTMEVRKPLAESMVSRILDSVENAAASKPKIDRFITRFARIYTPVVVALAAITAIVPSLVTGDWGYWVYTALSFLVMSCPCALVLSVPLAFFSGIGLASKKGILFKGGLSIEALASVKALALDKTGTVTRGDFRVRHIQGGEDLLGLCAACEQYSTHPIAASILAAAREKGLTPAVPEAVEELSGRGIRAKLEGRTVLCGNAALLGDQGVDLSGFRAQGHGTYVLVAVEGIYRGHVVISDTLKPNARAVMDRLCSLGIRTAMLTGDNEASARAVADEAGIHQVHAGLLPQEKLEILQKLRQEQGAIMFVGDGINDAPVLAGADVGAAMGSGADAAIEAADVVYMTADLDAIPESISIARRTQAIAWQNVVFALAVKLLVMVLGLLGFANMWMAVFADSGVAMLCVLNSVRLLYRKD